MSELVSNINRRIDSIAATEKLRMLTTEEINCQFLLKQLADHIADLEQDKGALQAKIDSLMLEFCPDEMTEEQFKNWSKHQVPASPDKGEEYFDIPDFLK